MHSFTCLHPLPTQGHIGAALVLGGVDKNGFHIYSIHPHGSTDRLPYTTMGSGSLAAMSVFEARWKPDMEVMGGMLYFYGELVLLFSPFFVVCLLLFLPCYFLSNFHSLFLFHSCSLTFFCFLSFPFFYVILS